MQSNINIATTRQTNIAKYAKWFGWVVWMVWASKLAMTPTSVIM